VGHDDRCRQVDLGRLDLGRLALGRLGLELRPHMAEQMTGKASLSRSARIVVVMWAVTGSLALALAARRLWVTGWPSATQSMFAVVFGALMAASWVRPIVLYIDDQPDAFDLDEGFFVLLVLLVPAAVTVIVFAVASIVAQALQRRPLAKSVFGVGQAVTSAGVAALAFVLLHGGQDPAGYAKVGAALIGALCYLVVNTVATVSILSTFGIPWGKTVFGGIVGKLLVAAGSIDIAVLAALLLARQPEFLPLAVLPLLLLRYLGEGHFYARNDRMRRRLFETTLDVDRSMGGDATRAALLGSDRWLLRSPGVSLTAEPPRGEDDTLAAPVVLADRRLWLSVSGRSRTEPFDDADRGLLDALASVGAIALSNADLYAEVERQKDNLAVIASSLGEGVCAISKTGEITFMNPAGAAMLGWPDVRTGDDPPLPLETPRFLLDPAMRAMSLRQNVVTDDTRFERADGTHFPVTMTASPVVGDSQPSAAVIVFRDTSERKAFEEQLARHAFQDPLTGLANRRLLLDHLDHALLQADRTGGRVAVLFGDIDRFKVVNDNLGHQLGDEMLRVVAERLRRAVRPGDTLSRFGGDEFVIILEGVTSSEDASLVADRVLHALREPIMLSGGHEVVTTMSIGMALSDTDTSRDDLLHDADVAMYRAKERGRAGQVTLFDVDRMGRRPAGRLDLDTALHHAVERNEVEVYFQPLISLADQRIVGAEALVRWDHPEHGILSPAHFIDLAEDNGTILPIGSAVLEQACRRAKEWLDTIGVRLAVGVNLSARQFRQAGLEEQIADVLQSTGIDPPQLCLEITESLAMNDVELTSAILAQLHGLGIRLAIDDFGTGHSSLGYMTRFPFDVIKIDQSFVRNIDQDPVKSAIVSAVVALSKAIGSTTVVEGVETLAELEQVEGLGCDMAQGFYFSRPLPAGAFDELLRSGPGPQTELRAPGGKLLTG
jgi:diguanylate cyclase (GGDEF)-like protein/PAS domain S-box-containing protein